MAWHWTHPENRRWQTAMLEHDVFGGVILVTRYGGSARRGFATRAYPVASRADLRRLLRLVSGRRRRHAYARSDAQS